jgi:drug/metabolite transporter (DMT)-like permease
MALLFGPNLRRLARNRLIGGIRGGIAAGVFLWAGYMLQTFGLKYTSAGKSGFITGLYIILVPLIGAIAYRRVPQSAEIGGLLLATAGLVLLTAPTLDVHLNVGDVLTIGCAVAFAFHLIVLGYYSQREAVEPVALGQIATTAALSAMSLWFEPARVQWTPIVVTGLLVTGVLATALAFALQTWGQRYTSATRTALIFALEPVFAMVTAVSLGGERLTSAGISGGLLILSGIVLVELKPMARR